MIPYSFLSKIRPYEVEVHGVKVKVTVVSSYARLLDEKVSELSATLKKRVMGVDLKIAYSTLSMLILCAEDRCLIIPRFGQSMTDFYSSSEDKFTASALGKLLSDQTICFVGMTLNGYESSTTDWRFREHVRNMVKKAGVELGFLAAMVLKKPSLQSKGLSEIAGEVSIDIKPRSPDKNNMTKEQIFYAQVFSEEDIKCAIHDVYGSYLVGKKLLGTLET